MGKEKMYYEELGYDFDPPFYRAKDKPVVTNADKIRSMTDEELAKFFADYVSCHDCPIPYCKVRFTMERLGCQANWLDWLKQEAGNG